VSSKHQTFPAKDVEDMITNMSLYHLIHSDDVELLWMFVKGSFWTYGTVLDDAHTITVRVAPTASPSIIMQPETGHTQPVKSGTAMSQLSLNPPHADMHTHTVAPDILLKLVGLDPVTRTGVFMSV